MIQSDNEEFKTPEKIPEKITKQVPFHSSPITQGTQCKCKEEVEALQKSLPKNETKMCKILSQLDCENSQQRDLQNENYTKIGKLKTEIAQLKQCIDGNTEEINKLKRYNNVRQEEDDHCSFFSANKQKVDTIVHETKTEDLTISTRKKF